ncbi:MAG: right-handed parallel beta-helix repeat-containing protein, partial [Planctomycetes bacterium]|nr:right-handed parallel beta-helix repeat-containing protein [Planctomycetota bacterium]
MQAIFFITCSNISVENCRFDGMKVGIKVATATNEYMTFRNITCNSIQGQGILVRNTAYTNVTGFHGNEMGQSKFDHAIYFAGDNAKVTISNINVDTGTGSAISVFASSHGDVDDVSITNVNVVDARNGFDLAETSPNTLTNVNVSNISIKNATAVAMQMISGTNITISNFVI